MGTIMTDKILLIFTKSAFRINILILFFIAISNIRSENLQELEEQLKNASGIQKPRILNKIAKMHDGKSYQKMRSYSTDALNLLENDNSVISSSSKKELALEKSLAYQNIGWSYCNEGDYASCQSYCEKALLTNEITGDAQDKAATLNLLGALYLKKNDIDKAKEYYESALELYIKLNDKNGIPKIYNNLGIIYKKKANYQKALEYYLESLKIHEEAQNKPMMASSYNNIAILYKQLVKNDLALEYYSKSMQLNKEMNNKHGLSLSYNNIAALYFSEGKYELALEYYSYSLVIRRELNDKEGIAIQLKNIADLKRKMGNNSDAIRLLDEAISLRKELRDNELFLDIYTILIEIYMNLNDFEKAKQYLSLGEKEVSISKDKEAIKGFYKTASTVNEKSGKFKEALDYYRKFYDLDKSIYNETLNEQFAQMQTKYETEKKDKENELLKKQTEIQKLTLQRQSIVLICSLIGIAFLIIFAIVSYSRYIEKKKDNEIIAIEKEKSEKLLLNILPESVAKDLKENGQTLPKTFENVTVFFSDIVTFTDISSKLDPNIVIGELNELFTAFDDIIEKNNCERIKTIGDAYLAVCGMPEENPNHAENMISAAIEIIQFLSKRNEENSLKWQVRIGIHSGKVVGGVVGVKKYIYDVFGDTINTCSRMETNSLPMKINVSEETFCLAKNKFKFTERNLQEVKGKGLVKMYFVV